MNRKLFATTAGLAGLALLATGAAWGQDASPEVQALAEQAAAQTVEFQFVFNTFMFLMMGLLVMFMAPGFAMLEAGLVRTKNTATILLKNIALFSIAGLMYWAFGYAIMYPGEFNGYFGIGDLFYNADSALEDDIGGGYSKMSDWWFQMVFVATAASIVSGALAERIKLWSFLLFVVVLTAVIYPIQGAWHWGGGWLYNDGEGFYDFAGSTIVHSVGGWAALVGAILLGARKGKYGPDGKVSPMQGANLPLATLGTFILWFGWFGFNGGSQLALGTGGDANAISVIFANTFVAAAAGVVGAMVISQIAYGKVDLTLALNGALGGLVGITAGPEHSNMIIPIIIGLVSAGLVIGSVKLLDTLKIDDVVGAIPVHLVCGIWGTLAVGIFYSDKSLLWQLIGIVSIGAFVVVTSAIVWLIIRAILGLRVSEEGEMMGLDKSELGMEAYPEFSSR